LEETTKLATVACRGETMADQEMLRAFNWNRGSAVKALHQGLRSRQLQVCVCEELGRSVTVAIDGPSVVKCETFGGQLNPLARVLLGKAQED
jgi:hypothetical protein